MSYSNERVEKEFPQEKEMGLSKMWKSGYANSKKEEKRHS